MEFTNRLRKNPEQKEERKIVFKKFIGVDASVYTPEIGAEGYAFVDVIAHMGGTEYVFEAYHLLEDKGTPNSGIFIGTWNGVE